MLNKRLRDRLAGFMNFLLSGEKNTNAENNAGYEKMLALK